MKLEYVGGVNCADRTCPSVYRTDRGTFVVQGPRLSNEDSASLVFGTGEVAVELPEEVLREVLRKLR